jgi:protein-S-isoprenylcysteine O-methyltransferase Ste14
MQDNSRKALSDYQRSRRLMLALILAIVSIGLVFVGSAHDELWHERIESNGMMLILVGIGGRLWSTLYIGGHKAARVIDTGPYSIMRNPLYFFSTIAAAGVGMQAGSIWLGLAFAFGCWAAFSIVTRREERWLAANLGQPYLDYVARVPRFFPNPFIYRDQPEVTFNPRLLNRTWLDGLAFFASVPILETLETLQQSGWISVVAHLW